MRVALILCVYFAVGGLATSYAVSGAERARKRAYWIKYIVYLLLTAGITAVLSAAPGGTLWIGIVIWIIALLEIGRAFGITSRYDRRGILLLPFSLLSFFFLIFCHHAPVDPLVLQVYILVVSFDGFSQITGQVVRSKKLMPRISPGKTRAGFAGGVIATALTGMLLLAPDWQRGLLLGLGIAITAFTGDALASALKRRAGIKDFGTLIPGHGGVLDRFDSFIFSGAVVAAVCLLNGRW